MILETARVNFNCTIQELKRLQQGIMYGGGRYFNCTIQELKLEKKLLRYTLGKISIAPYRN